MNNYAGALVGLRPKDDVISLAYDTKFDCQTLIEYRIQWEFPCPSYCFKIELFVVRQIRCMIILTIQRGSFYVAFHWWILPYISSLAFTIHGACHLMMATISKEDRHYPLPASTYVSFSHLTILPSSSPIQFREGPLPVRN